MKKKKFATNINLSELAKELGISSMTLYRVMNNEPAVRPSTKKRVIEALNKKGYNAYQGQTGGKVVFDFSHNNYLLYFGAQLMQRLSDNRFSIVLTNHRERRIAFLDAAAEAPERGRHPPQQRCARRRPGGSSSPCSRTQEARRGSSSLESFGCGTAHFLLCGRNETA